ncbi:tRNA (adenosine(37)-N6)-threonylcarbamoyltransferase complex dimerization subunit type 1 TsaB [bacterium]|nr:tRNA (adenosine(37)-N6)-threonylcarbamoyltransferase complex dimerization subunit type 1 TsaB [bacterium]
MHGEINTLSTESHILLIETSGNTCSAGISKGQLILDQKTIAEPNSHSKLLAPMVEELLKNQNISTSNLSAVALSEGPGSYTGLRIGASLAKGICYASKIPLISVPTLQAWAYAAFKSYPHYDLYGGIIDARREDAYVAVYNRKFRAAFEAQFVSLTEEVLSKIDAMGQIAFAGSGCEKLSKRDEYKAIKSLPELSLNSEHLLPFAYDKFINKDFEDLAYFEPNYIKSVYTTSPKK